MTPRRTIAQALTVTGTALHAGKPVHMILSPANAGIGIVFRRADLRRRYSGALRPGERDPAGHSDREGQRQIGVVEHLMAAVAGRRSMTCW